MDLIMAHLSLYGIMYAFYTCLGIPIGTFLMAYAVPKNIIQKYFRQPYFNDGDDELFKLFPFTYYLTLWIAQCTACNWFAKRRKMYDLRKDSPRYWVILSFIYFWLIVIPPIFAFLLCLLSIGYFQLTGHEVPKI